MDWKNIIISTLLRLLSKMILRNLQLNWNWHCVHYDILITYNFHFLTINAPLILKMRDIIFFCGQTT
jgi:hypothetical protein